MTESRNLVDTHCHLGDYFKPSEVVGDASKAGVDVIGMTRSPAEYALQASRFGSFANVRIALGVHPLDAHKMTSAAWSAFERILPGVNYVGEVGLDFSEAGAPTRIVQEATLQRVLDATATSRHMLSVHSRRAEKRVYELLQDSRSGPVVFHWYSGSLSFVDNLLDRGDLFSINPSMLRSAKGRAIIARLPQERVLLESDGPFTKTASRPSWPSDVRSVQNGLATMWSMSPANVSLVLWRNLQRLRKSRADDGS